MIHLTDGQHLETCLNWEIIRYCGFANVNCIALSSAETEYISTANATTEIIWLVKFLQELDMEQALPIVLFEDSQSTIKLIQSDKHHSRTKHIVVLHHHIKHHQTTVIFN